MPRTNTFKYQRGGLSLFLKDMRQKMRPGDVEQPRQPPEKARVPVPEHVGDVVSSVGQPLEQSTRDFFEPRFGHDFSRVRVHTDPRAARSAEALSARAYTLGKDVSFGPGMYAPATTEGRRILAHELAHVVQQSRGGPSVPLSAEAPHEQEAASAASRLTAGASEFTVRRGTAVGLARDDKPMTPAHAGGQLGEVDASFVLGKMGYDIVTGPGGPGGHKLTEPGIDIVARDPKTGEVLIVDNKASGGTRRIYKADAITKNIRTNLQAKIKEVGALPDFPGKADVLSKLQAADDAIRQKQPLPAGVRIVVTNAGGYHTGIGKGLAKQGVTFIDVVGPDVIAARKADITAAKAQGVKPGRPTTHPTKAAPTTPPPAAPVKPKATDFQTSGNVIQTDASGVKIRPTTSQPTMRGTGSRPRFSPKGAGLVQLLPAAVNALQDKLIRHRVASEMLGLWPRVEAARRANPNDVIIFVVSLQEWERPDPAGNVARAVRYVDFFHGATEQEAEAKGSNLLRSPAPKGWREVGPFIGVLVPSDSLDEAREQVAKEEGCFIATACYGSPSATEVAELRAFRDLWLMRQGWGRRFVGFYYRVSPPIARLLEDHASMRLATRALLIGPIVWLVMLLRPSWRSDGAEQRIEQAQTVGRSA